MISATSFSESSFTSTQSVITKKNKESSKIDSSEVDSKIKSKSPELNKVTIKNPYSLKNLANYDKKVADDVEQTLDASPNLLRVEKQSSSF